MACSSSGVRNHTGRLPLRVENIGSNPVQATKK